MKAELKHQKPVFDPVELTINIESEEDLALLWAVFNSSSVNTKSSARGTWAEDYVKEALAKPGDSMLVIWESLDNERQRRGL